MWLLELFRKKAPPPKKSSQSHLAPHRLHARIEKLEAEKKTLHLLLHTHHETLLEHTRLLEHHTRTLDDLVDSPRVSRVQKSEPEPHQEAVDFVPKFMPKRPESSPKPDKLHLHAFSRQEQKILTVFFQHPGMALSYADIGTMLQKSSNTIKNQMRQLTMKADLFSKTTDAENRNRFQLKEGLRIEPYLNLGKPVGN